MYGFLWHLIPGPRLAKVIIAVAVVVAVFFLLMEVVFPWVSAIMPYNDVAV
ncbi:hypothetical protein [Corynebacterium belfantii]|uniref:Uncharacterized protein n=1 Tax=Corynebacterium belfantii TaxID=2014537 RepID=A0ABS0LC56_9CORY|nr:hypothetical protein [Corynebacterium belfantii]QVI99496.1 hypothetical protein KFR76_05375 [Corynebacterium diphtheriae]SPJ42175.1 hypothetical protein CHUV2995_03010 [Corynebacterium diphtheriae subsp. lausannense]MBG9243478.1 hypothetical protein [Corynebacterium belfantii]MBG9258803.1 hypothetical protein [Corynebacterium belfantii]MBG9265548.1 hypothetical protein [Corynebacterium belfantii]